MIKKMIINSFVIIALASNAFAVEKTTYDENNNSITFCENEKSCQHINVPEELKEKIIGNDIKVEVFAGNKKYLLITSDVNTSVNICFDSYLIINNRVSSTSSNILPSKFDNIFPDGNDLCLYRKINNSQLISSYRLTAKWYEELYQYKNGNYELVSIDECIDCGMIYRTYYDGREPRKLIVSDDPIYENRKPLTAIVIADKAMLYDSPDELAMGEMYLIKGDSVTLLDHFFSNSTDSTIGKDWYLVSYESSKRRIIIRWIKESSIEIEHI